MTYPELIINLKKNINFSFSRFGDGEFNCMFGKSGENCDGHAYFPDLMDALNKSWENPKGIISVQRYGYNMYKNKLGDNIWPSADILHMASISSNLDVLHEDLSNRTVIMVGPKHLESLKWIDKFIYVPKKNAWLKKEGIKVLIKPYLKNDNVIIYCCGMMAEVLIHELYDKSYTQIDAGSVFDPYCGVKSRMYHYKL